MLLRIGHESRGELPQSTAVLPRKTLQMINAATAVLARTSNNGGKMNLPSLELRKR
jgi:hypothetical protein